MLLNGLGRALEAPDPVAAPRIARIEALRRELLADPTELEVVDYGAGRAGSGPAPTIRRPVAVACRASKSPFWCRILFEMMRAMAPCRAVELGTCVGISASYQATAQELAGGGHLWTLEGAPALAALARRNLEGLGLSSVTVVEGPFADTLEGVLDVAAPVDWAFIDGHHEERATLTYFRAFLPHLAERAVLLFDDIAWRPACVGPGRPSGGTSASPCRSTSGRWVSV